MFTHDDRPIRVLLADLTDVADTVRDLDPAAPNAELTALLAREHALVLELRRRRAQWRAAHNSQRHQSDGAGTTTAQ